MCLDVQPDESWIDDLFLTEEDPDTPLKVQSTKRKKPEECTIEELEMEIMQTEQRVVLQKEREGRTKEARAAKQPVQWQPAVVNDETLRSKHPIPGSTRKGGLAGGFWQEIENGSASHARCSHNLVLRRVFIKTTQNGAPSKLRMWNGKSLRVGSMVFVAPEV